MADAYVPSPTNSSPTTRGLRSSTLPSSPGLPILKHPHTYRSHKHNRSHQLSSSRWKEDEQKSSSALSNVSSAAGLVASPLNELFTPVKTVASGLSGLGVGKEKDKEKDRVSSGMSAKEREEEEAREAARKAGLKRELEKERERRKEVERSLVSRLNAITTTTYAARDLISSTETTLATAIPSLNSTLSSLRALVSSSSSLLSTLTDDSIPALTTEFTSQISTLRSSFDGIENERIAGLEARIKIADERVKELSERVKMVRRVVEDSEEKEREEMGRRRRRLGIVWALMGCLVAIWVISVVVRNWPGDAELERKRAELKLEKFKGNWSENGNWTDHRGHKERGEGKNRTGKAERSVLGRIGLEGKGKKLEGPANKSPDVCDKKSLELEERNSQELENEEVQRVWRMFDEL